MGNSYLEFRRDANGNIAGNIYTAYRCYIHDFGYGAIVVFQVVLAFFYGIWYEKLNYRSMKKNIDLNYVLFAWFMIILFRFSIYNGFFTNLAYFMFSYWYMFLFWKILLQLRISFRRNKDEGMSVSNNSDLYSLKERIK